MDRNIIPSFRTEDFVGGWQKSPFANLSAAPWEIKSRAIELIADQVQKLNSDYVIDNGIAIHKTVNVEPNATLKSPIIIGDDVRLGANSVVAPDAIIESGFMLKRLGHVDAK